MTPQLETSGSAAGAPLQVPPPRFRPLGQVSHVSIQFTDYCQTGRGLTEAQKNGLRYEAYVQAWLRDQFENYNPEPTIRCLDNQVSRELRPDGVLLYPDRVFIFEVKYSHVPESWWQLEKLYKVALGKLYHCPISLVEVCRSYDPAMPYPVPVTLVTDLEDWISRPRSDLGVYVWRKSTT